MDHNEAVRLMATERYLLGEMAPPMRDAFEEHFFDCAECASDLRAGAAFVREAKVQLAGSPPAVAVVAPRPARRHNRLAWWKSAFLTPAWMAPAFAALLLFIGYQNFSTIPSLRSAASEPHLAPWATLHVGTRDGAPLPVVASPRAGAVILMDVPETGAYTSYAFTLDDPAGRQFWTQTLASSPTNDGAQTLSLLIPGLGLRQGTYALTISGITAQGNRTQLDRRVLDVRFNE